MALRWLCRSLCVLSLALGVTAVLYEDQLHDYAWHHQRLGHVTHAHFTHTGSLVTLSSQHSLLASLRTDDTLEWRYPLPAADTATELRVRGERALTVSACSGAVRAHNTRTGALLWDTGSAHSTDATEANSCQLAAGVLALVGDGGVVSWFNGTIRLHRAENGEIRWERALDVVAAIPGSALILAVARASKSARIESLKLSDGSSVGTADLGRVDFSTLVTSDTFVAWMDEARAAIEVVDTADGERPRRSSIPLSKVADQTALALMPTGLRLRPVEQWPRAFVLESSNGRQLIEMKSDWSDQQWSRAFGADCVIGSTAVTVTGVRHFAVFQIIETTNSTTLHTLVYRVDEDEPVVAVDHPYRRGERVVRGWLGAINGSALSVAVVSSDHRLTVCVAGSCPVDHDEALASIVSLQFAPLPPDSAIHAHSFQRLTLAARIQAQIEGVIQSLTSLVQFSGNQRPTKATHTAVTTSVALHSDAFGFRQVLVAATAAGLLFGIETEFGSVVWSTRVADQSNGESIWRTELVHPRCLTVIVQSERGFETADVDPAQGTILSKRSHLTKAADALIVTPLRTGDDKRILLAIHGASVVLHPNTPEAVAKIRAHRDHLHYYTVNAKDGVVEGFTLAGADVSAAGTATATASWRLALPNTERVASLARSHPSDNVASATRLIDEGAGLLYKFLDPALIAVATVRRSAGTSGSNTSKPLVASLKRGSDPSVCVYLIDAVSGVVVEKIVHRQATGPVRAVIAENSVVYSYRDLASLAPALSVADLFEARQGAKLSLAQAVQASLAASDSFDSFTEPAPTLVHQSFLLRSPLVSLDTTRSRHGITGKEFLGLTTSGQLLAWPKSLLDARRPIHEPTIGERAEGLMPYSPELPFAPALVASANATIVHARDVITAPTLLESTSIVCVYGVDLWCARQTPSSAFDRLNDEFNYPFLLATVAAVVAGIAVTKRWAKKKELDAAWR